MITNLFSAFDPSSSILSLSWLNIIFITQVIPTNTWNSNSNFTNNLNNIINIFNNEVSYTLNSNNSTNTIIITVFLIIILINTTALYPQVFSSSSHLVVTLPLAATSWLSIFLFTTRNNTNHFLVHLVPQGTPTPLLPLIVLIETVSIIIRPITLCVRLTANLIAGHLLLSLLGNIMLNLSTIYSTLMLVIPLTLAILECAVAFIQAYVFITLLSLYLSETN